VRFQGLQALLVYIETIVETRERRAYVVLDAVLVTPGSEVTPCVVLSGFIDFCVEDGPLYVLLQ
jgi:hypothetical protein